MLPEASGADLLVAQIEGSNQQLLFEPHSKIERDHSCRPHVPELQRHEGQKREPYWPQPRRRMIVAEGEPADEGPDEKPDQQLSKMRGNEQRDATSYSIALQTAPHRAARAPPQEPRRAEADVTQAGLQHRLARMAATLFRDSRIADAAVELGVNGGDRRSSNGFFTRRAGDAAHHSGRGWAENSR